MGLVQEGAQSRCMGVRRIRCRVLRGGVERVDGYGGCEGGLQAGTAGAMTAPAGDSDEDSEGRGGLGDLEKQVARGYGGCETRGLGCLEGTDMLAIWVGGVEAHQRGPFLPHFVLRRPLTLGVCDEETGVSVGADCVGRVLGSRRSSILLKEGPGRGRWVEHEADDLDDLDGCADGLSICAARNGREGMRC